MSVHLTKITSMIANWEGVTIAPHRYGGIEIILGTQEIGHILENDTLEIPFPKSIRQQLIQEGKASPHPIFAQSGWINYCICSPAHVYHAVWLLKFSWQVNRIRQFRSQVTEAMRRDIESELSALLLSTELRNLVTF